ncbi:DUF4350 domain-containing protein [Pedobacter frigiditerrae]|uniref:DUF4350 domain-containing protein n=1 Tax=Pedobacter frigiditerrae TaxID=2530452 RepID=A0A4R0N237_9SPHI|nr:DUF4350 domain-containing protein [Pedobacter frigiditerrae]TCC93387.1 DUF4350 domain-containing protein [Pedobacter frigiditerrae]
MKGFRKYLVFGSILLVIYFVAQYFKPKPTDWSPSYLSADKIPFGTYILRQRIGDLFPGVQVKTVDNEVYSNIKGRPEGKSNYFIIASNLKVDKLDYQEMVKYMEAGNNIFIAASNIQGMLVDTLKINITSNFNFQNKRKYPINFVNPSLNREYDYYFDKGISEQYFHEVDSSRAIVLGQKEKKFANFIQYKYGSGSLFILPNPELLTNYSLLREDGLDYASKALSYLPKTKNLIWDEHFTRPASQNKSVLRVFFEYDQLRWAYYIALLSLVVFVLFEIKRRQRVIPVIDRLKNTSVEFVSVVGRVYYQQRNNRDIAEKKVIYLMEYIRSKYRLKTININQEFKETLIRVSGATEEVIEELFTEIIYLNAGGMVRDQQLIMLNKIIEQFYKQDQ